MKVYFLSGTHEDFIRHRKLVHITVYKVLFLCKIINVTLSLQKQKKNKCHTLPSENNVTLT